MATLPEIRLSRARASRAGESFSIEVGARPERRDVLVGLVDPWGRLLWTRRLAPGGPVGLVQSFGVDDLSGTYRLVLEAGPSRRIVPIDYRGGAPAELRSCLTFWLEVARRGPDPARDFSFLLSYPRSAGPAQVLESLRTSEPAGIATDLAGSSWLRVETPSIDDRYEFRYDAVVRTRAVLYDVEEIRRGAETAPVPGSGDPAWLRSEPGIEADAPAIRAAAASLAGSRPEDVVRSAHEFVRSRVRYRLQSGEWGALAGLEAGEGDCTELAALLVALSRARGIPARVVLGRRTGSSALHAIAEARILGAWMPLDVTNEPLPSFGLPADWIGLFQKNWIGGQRGDSQFSFRYRSPGKEARLEIRDRQRLRRLRGPSPARGVPVESPPAPGPFRVSLRVAEAGRLSIAVESGASTELPAELLLSAGRDALRVVRVWSLLCRPGTRLETELDLGAMGGLPVDSEELRADLVDRTGRVLATGRVGSSCA